MLTALLGRIVNGVFNINYTSVGVLRSVVFANYSITHNKSFANINGGMGEGPLRFSSIRTSPSS